MNKQKILTLFLAFLIIGVLFACSNMQDKNNKGKSVQPNAKTTKLKFTSKYENFGIVKPDTLLIARFDLKNTGTHPLIIYNVNPDCSCTDFHLSNDTIIPGKSGFIELVLNTEGKYGHQKIYAVVEANTDAKLYKLTLEAKIQ